MRFFASIFAAAAIATVSIAVAAETETTTVKGGAEHWVALPGPSGQGLMQAVLLGDPSTSGFFVVRIKAPPNYRFLPHTHPNRHNITVLSGTYYFGVGRTFNKTAMTEYRAGAFVSVPAGVAHYAMTGSSGAVVQEDGMGPNIIQPLKM